MTDLIKVATWNDDNTVSYRYITREEAEQFTKEFEEKYLESRRD